MNYQRKATKLYKSLCVSEDGLRRNSPRCRPGAATTALTVLPLCETQIKLLAQLLADR